MTKQFLTAQEVADITGSSLSKSYSMIRELNRELKEKNYFIVPGKISRKYFEERFYGVHATEQG